MKKILLVLCCLAMAAPAQANGGLFGGGLFRRNNVQNVRVKEVVNVQNIRVKEVVQVRQVVQQKVVQQVVQQKVFAAPLYVAPVQAYVQSYSAYPAPQAFAAPYCAPAAFSAPYQAPFQAPQSQTFAEVQAKSKLLELELQILQFRQAQTAPK